MNIIHIFTNYQTMGGVEAVLKRHHAEDAEWGFNSRFVILSEDGPSGDERVCFLAREEQSTIQKMRAGYRRCLGATKPDVAVYHTPWSMPYLVDLDQAARRTLILHGEVPHLAGTLEFRRPWLDGIFCVSEPLRQLAARVLPGWDEKRATLLPYPISPPGRAIDHSPLSGRPLVIGFCGRITKEQKRVDRLPGLCRHVDAAGIAFRLEFLGDGPDRPWLESQLVDRKKFVFHGRRQGADYWQTMAGWDVALSLSDYEGTPIALLEAMSQGVIPIYPKIGSGGDHYAAQVDSRLLYTPEDWPRVTEKLRWLGDATDEEVQRLRARCRQAVQAHVGDGYFKVFSNFTRAIAATPRISHSQCAPRPFPVDRMPLKWVKHLGTLRRLWRSKGKNSLADPHNEN